MRKRLETSPELAAAFQLRRGVGQRTALYRLYDADDVLLYVGITKNTVQRWSQHSKTKPWWRKVAKREVTWFDSRPDALLAEHRAIVAEHPLHNSLHDPQGSSPGIGPSKYKIAAVLGVKGPSVDSIIEAAERGQD
jgi:predicted GIY-YIG superfamily endonuclease